MKYIRNIRLCLLLLILGVEICFLVGLNRLDNKYTWPGTPGYAGVTDLTMPQERKFVYLIHGWEVYEGGLFSPEDIRESGRKPDRYVSLGRYGGFEFGDKTKDPRGSVTYRMRVLLPDEEAEYCLELPEIFSAYRLWINGRLVQTMGIPEKEQYKPHTSNSYAVFDGQKEAELVFAVSNYSSYYSGMVYPPAFGDTAAIRNTINIRAVTHGMLASSTIFLGLICLFIGYRGGDSKIYWSFFLLCMCFACYVGYPVIHFLNIQGDGWYLAEKLGIYTMLLTLCVLAGSMFKISLAMQSVIFGTGTAVCLLVAAFPFFPMRWDVETMRLYSRILSGWQWTAALYLGILSIRACLKAERFSWGFMVGTAVFGCALILRQVLPVFEPVYTGWPMEWSGLLQIGVIAGGFTADTRKAEWKMAELKRRVDMAEEHLNIQKDYAQVLSLYLKQTGKRNHEVKKHMELLNHYYESAQYDKLGAYIRDLYENEGEIGVPLYTANILINSIITARFRRAESMGIRTEHNLLEIPQNLVIADSDLCSLLVNMLDNAIEGCQRLKGDREPWIKVGMQVHNRYFSIVVENAAKDPPKGWEKRGLEEVQTEKKDKNSHGYGLEIIGEIVEKYQGMMKIRWEKGVFFIHAALHIPDEKQRSSEN